MIVAARVGRLASSRGAVLRGRRKGPTKRWRARSDAGNVGTTDFDLTEDEKKGLLKAGRDDVSKFLKTYTPARYMNTFGNKLT